MDNYEIADAFALLAKLMDIHGENSFKVKTYSNAAYTIEKLPTGLKDMAREKIFAIKGIGEATGKKIIEMLDTGRLTVLDEYVEKTPPGIIEMLLNVKGLGAKKIAVIWKEMGIENIGELLYACSENRLMLYKGFGEKTQKSVKQNIEFFQRSQGNFLYAQIDSYASALLTHLEKAMAQYKFAYTGAFRRQMETLNSLEWVTNAPAEELEAFLASLNYKKTNATESVVSFTSEGSINLNFFAANNGNFGSVLFQTSCSPAFLDAWQQQFPDTSLYADEQGIFEMAGVGSIPAFLRETPETITKAKTDSFAGIITPADVKGIIHTHSNWSDGANTIEEMAVAARDAGFEYLVMSDHSKSAFYANGLQVERLLEQHAYIDSLNEKLKPFRIFKSIEADILNDGSLDYSDEVLATFDLVIASVHSNLKMAEEKAMGRLLNAIRNPYTTILGHMTGRLLLSREGYPVDYRKLIDACIENRVAIELNAHPRRLDVDWRHIDYIVSNGGLISIDPDSHAIEGYSDIKYGVLAAQKGGVTPVNNLSSFTLSEFEHFLQQRRTFKGL